MLEPHSELETNPAKIAIAKMLSLHAAGRLLGSLGRFAAGLAVSALIGIPVASVVTFVLFKAFGTTWLGWNGWYGVYVVVLLPILVWREGRVRNNYLEAAVRQVDPAPSSMGQHKLEQATLQVGVAVALVAWGPRAIGDGLRGLYAARRGSLDPAVVDRAAILIVDLGQYSGGIDVARLMHPPEPVQTLDAAVELLQEFGWIGRSSSGSTVWLDSTFRRKLKDAGLVPEIPQTTPKGIPRSQRLN